MARSPSLGVLRLQPSPRRLRLRLEPVGLFLILLLLEREGFFRLQPRSGLHLLVAVAVRGGLPICVRLSGPARGVGLCGRGDRVSLAAIGLESAEDVTCCSENDTKHCKMRLNKGAPQAQQGQHNNVR